jgi:hypothetical protein
MENTAINKVHKFFRDLAEIMPAYDKLMHFFVGAIVMSSVACMVTKDLNTLLKINLTIAVIKEFFDLIIFYTKISKRDFKTYRKYITNAVLDIIFTVMPIYVVKIFVQ